MTVSLPTPPTGKKPHLSASDREGETDKNIRKVNTEDAGANKPALGLVQGFVLEGGDGADAGRPPILGKNNICKRDRCKSLTSHLA